jgi:hypothetical protein
MKSEDALAGRAEPRLLVRFSSPAEFAAELRARGPNVEPVVRLTFRWTAASGALPLQAASGALPLHHLSVVASYLRRLSDGALVVHELTHYAGDIWRGIPTDGSERSRARASEARDLVARTAEELGLDVCAGVYALPEAVA